jgi:hypothetical protein
MKLPKIHKNKNIAGVITTILLACYFLTGCFPFVSFETDSMAIASACQHIINTGEFKAAVIGHSFDMQSGSYFLIVELAKLLHITTLNAYFILVFGASILYFTSIVLFVHRLTNFHFLPICILLFLFPEVSTLGYYPNSMVIAAATWLSGILISLYYPTTPYVLLSGLIMGIAGWLRIDILFVFPTVLPAFYIVTKEVKKSVLFSLYLAAISITVILSLMYFSGAEVAGFLGYTDDHGTLFKMSNNIGLLDVHLIRAHLSSFSLLLITLIAFGIIYLIKQRHWSFLVLLLLGTLFYYLMGINNTVAPKHLSSAIPFWLIIALFGWKFISNHSYNKQLITFILLPLFVFQYLIGFVFEIDSVPYADKEYSILHPSSSLVKMAQVNLGQKGISKVNIGLGPGTKIPSSDEIMLSSGLIFNPLSWHIMKKKKRATDEAIIAYLDTLANDKEHTFIVAGGSSQQLVNLLMNQGFQWTQDTLNYSKMLRFRDGEKDITLAIEKDLKKFDPQSFHEAFKKYDTNTPVVYLWDWQIYTMNEFYEDEVKLANGFYLVNTK